MAGASLRRMLIDFSLLVSGSIVLLLRKIKEVPGDLCAIGGAAAASNGEVEQRGRARDLVNQGKML